MRIVFNSDVLFNFAQARRPGDVPTWLSEFIIKAGEAGATVVIPETALLELKRIQAGSVEQMRDRVAEAAARLGEWGATVDPEDVRALVVERDLFEELHRLGNHVVLEPPTMEDFQDAHRRACLRLAPHLLSEARQQQDSTDSDEMRDLVIWAMAMRFAKADGRAILLSKDKMHTGKPGDAEARAAQLHRQKGADSALSFLGVETEAERSLKTLLAPAWSALRDRGLPIPAGAHMQHRVRATRFVQGDDGNASEAEGDLTVEVAAGQNLKAHVRLERVVAGTNRVTVSGASFDGGDCPSELTVDVPVP